MVPWQDRVRFLLLQSPNPFVTPVKAGVYHPAVGEMDPRFRGGDAKN